MRRVGPWSRFRRDALVCRTFAAAARDGIRPGLERRFRLGARAARDRPARARRSGYRAARLQGPGSRVSLLPRAVRRRAHRAATADKSGPVGAGSVLEGARIVLDNALWEGRFWLPFRQEVEIRRRATWLDIPTRGIIRGRWEIDGYRFNLGLADGWFRGDEITALPKVQRDSFPWRTPLSAAIQNVAEPVRENDLQRVRAEVSRIAGRRALTGLKRQRLGARALSELVHVDRVEGLAVGAGFVWRTPNDGFELRGLGSYGFADRAGKGSVALTSADGFELAAYRQVRDIADVPVIAPLLNSIGAQEFGDDFGDYYRATGVRFGARAGIGTRGESRFSISRERVASLAVRASPAAGRFRPDPLMRDGDYSTAALTIRRRSEGFAVRRDVAGEASLEVGERYTRMSGVAHWLVPIGRGQTRVLTRVQFGAASSEVPPHRGFVLGGRGTLLA